VSRSAGFALAAATTVIWGGQWVVGGSALAHVDAFNLTTIRYAAASPLLLGLVTALEGRSALRVDGRGLSLFALGTLGFAAFNLCAYIGLDHAGATSASLITSLSPLLAAFLLWLQGHGRPTGTTLAALLVAVIGVAIVIGHGDPVAFFTGAFGWGDLLVLAGVTSFLIYTIGAGGFPNLSPLRYTALTATLGWLSIAGATAIVDVTGAQHVPTASALAAALPALTYITILGAVISVTTWNLGVAIIGTQNAALFMNLMPITTFGIQIARGYHASAAELGGVAVTIVALVGGNLASR
jgi:drug/metabolite transporter (DMT)-like permease